MSRAVATLALLALGACADLEPPGRTPAYPFADALYGDVFHWPSDRLPVRYYAEPRGNLRVLVQYAIGAWQDQFLYGEYSGALTDDSTHADVIVRWADSVPPDVPPDAGPPVKACGGRTDFVRDATGTGIAGPMHTELSVLTGSPFSAAQVQACMRRTTIHELGHTLGLLQEATGDTLIMYFTPLVPWPASGDRQTVEVLYHTPPTLRPPPP